VEDTQVMSLIGFFEGLLRRGFLVCMMEFLGLCKMMGMYYVPR